MEKIKLDIIGISYSQSQSGAYALVLGESGGRRRLPIIIGGFEAQAIAIELENMKPERPLTHDLFKFFAESYNIKIIEVVINKFLNGVFYARLVCYNGKEELEIDARTSDAVALAVRFQCPIYTYEKVLKTAGVMIDENQRTIEIKETIEEDESIFDIDDNKSEFSDFKLDELQKLLMEAIAEEAFERASKIRDEIKKRK